MYILFTINSFSDVIRIKYDFIRPPQIPISGFLLTFDWT